MSTFQIVEARRHHCGKMARMLRQEHQRAALLVGLDTHRELRNCYDRSWYRRAWLIDGLLAGLGGVMGTMMAPAGFIWLALSERATRYPIEIVKEARRQLDFLMTVKRELHTTIVPSDEAALRLSVFLGFHAADEGPGASAFSRHGRRQLMTYLGTDAPRLKIGDTTMIRLGYHAPMETA